MTIENLNHNHKAHRTEILGRDVSQHHAKANGSAEQADTSAYPELMSFVPHSI